MTYFFSRIFFATLFAGALGPSMVWACASCGCTLSSDWESSTQEGPRMEIRYDYINQNQLRSGASSISPGAASLKINNGDNQEIEKYTVNNYLTFTFNYTFNDDWKLDLQLPYIMRRHSTLGTESDGYTPGPNGGEYDSNYSEIGDVKLMMRFQGLLAQHTLGLMAGLKLPTGRYNLEGQSTDVSNQAAVPIDRGLQPGTGTTDLILGLYYSDALNQSWDYYSQAFYQYALNSQSQYRPGDGINVNLGLRYMQWTEFIPQIQINSRFVQKDTGAQADQISTGGTLVYLSPGFSIPVGKQTAIYTFVQVPIYQFVEGVQLTPSATFSIGLRYML